MGITIINYILGPTLLALAIFVMWKNRKSINSILICTMLLGTFFVAVGTGLGYDLGNKEMFESSLWLVKFAGIGVFTIYFSIFRLSLSYPYEKSMKATTIIMSVLLLAIFYVILFTPLYVSAIELRNGIFFRVEGSLYKYMSLAGMLLLIASIVIFLIRKSKMENRIHKLQINIIVIGNALSVLVGVMVSIVVPSVFGIFTLYPLGSLVGVVMGGSLIYAISTYRMFDISSALYKTLIFLIFSSVIGVLAGVSFGLANKYLSEISPYLTVAALAILFGLLLLLRKVIQKNLVRIFKRKTEYSEDLEKGLDSIDFSKGKEDVTSKLVEILSNNVGTSKVTILSETMIGELTISFSSANIEKMNLEKNDEFVKHLVNIHQEVIFKTEVYTNPIFAKFKVEILDLFLQLSAEAIALFIEGTSLIGVIALGEKESMEQYDTYDFKIMNKIMPKLFVIMYYLRNIERQSVAITVDKEVKLSEQIISSLLENIDHIESENVDCYFLNKFTSGLGGDFVDIIKLGKTKTMMIVGDLAGKGINASMSMIILKSVIHTFLKETSDFKMLITKVNSFIKANLPRGTFLAGLFMIYDSATNQVFYVNCGIPLVYLFSNDYNSVIEIQGEGKILGFVKDISKFLVVKKVNLNSGDILFMTTDGIIESESLTGEMFGKEKVHNHILENKDKTSKEIVDSLFGKFSNFVSNAINDDITIVSLKYAKKPII